MSEGKKVTCFACGSGDLEDEVVVRKHTASTGAVYHYAIIIQRCLRCHEGGDFAGVNPLIVPKIIHAIEVNEKRRWTARWLKFFRSLIGGLRP